MAEYEGFDYGTEDVVEAGGTYKQPEIGDHSARLRSIIHLGMFRETFNGKLKSPAPQAVAIFELKDEEDFEEDGETPLTLHKAFPLKKGDRTFTSKLLAALDPKGVAKGFDDLIGMACTVKAAPSKAVDETGKPKYVNFGGLAGMPAKFAKLTDELKPGGAGHVRFEDLTKEAILELNPILEVANILMKGENYKGSKAEKIIEEIRKDNPDFAKAKEPDKADRASQDAAADKAAEEVPCDLDDSSEY